MASALEKIHLIRKRTKAARECAPRPVVEGLIRVAASVLRRANRSRIVVRSENAVVIDTSVTGGVVAAIASPRIIFLGIMAVLLSPWEVRIDRPRDLRE